MLCKRKVRKVFDWDGFNCDLNINFDKNSNLNREILKFIVVSDMIRSI